MIQENNMVPRKAIDIMDDKPEAAVVEHKFDAVVTGTTIKKQSGIGKFFRQLFADDMRTVRQTFREDVLIPFVQDGISGIFHDGIDLLIYGNKGRSRGSRTRGMFGNMKTRYNEKYRSSIEGSRIRRGSSRDDDEDDEDVEVFDDNLLIFRDTSARQKDARAKAERVLDTMMDALERYPSVSVADLYDIAGVSNIVGDFTDKNYGWTDLSDAKIRRARGGGFFLDLPKAEDIRDL